MKLHKILLRHAGPKSQVEVTERYVLANTEREIFDRLDCSKSHTFTYGAWKEKDEPVDEDERSDDDRYNGDGVRLLEICNEDYEVIGTETFVERMLRLRGEFNDDDADFEDAYYGVKHWGWSEGVDITSEDALTLLRLSIAEDWRAPAAIGPALLAATQDQNEQLRKAQNA